MARVSTDTSNLAPLNKIFRHPSKLGEAGLTVSDIVDNTLEGVGMFFENGIDNVPKVLRKGIATLVHRGAFRMVFATP